VREETKIRYNRLCIFVRNLVKAASAPGIGPGGGSEIYIFSEISAKTAFLNLHHSTNQVLASVSGKVGQDSDQDQPNRLWPLYDEY
jgi:hypothetical protein